jgi:hypothetical protein
MTFRTAKIIRCKPSLRAQRSNPFRGGKKDGLLRCARNDGALIPHTTSRSRGALRPSCASIFRPKRAWGMPDAQCTRGLVAIVVVERTRVTTSTPESPGIPARNGFTAYVVLSPVTGSFATVASRIWFCHCPVGLTKPPQDLTQRRGVRTTRFCRTRKHLSSACRISLTSLIDPPCDPVARKTLPRPPHPVPYVRNDRETPLCVGRDAWSSSITVALLGDV